MKDSVDFNVKFIQMVQERPCLYDYTRTDYNYKTFQDAAWLEISKKVNESAADCKERWKNIRGCYTRHLKNKNRQSGAKFVKPYYLAEPLQFLKRFTKTRQPKHIFKTEDFNSEIDPEANTIGGDPLVTRIVEDSEESYEIGSPAASSPTNDFSQANILIKKPKMVSESEVTALEQCGARQTYAKFEMDENQDPDVAFFYSLLPDVKEMNAEQKRKFKMGVLKLVVDTFDES